MWWPLHIYFCRIPVSMSVPFIASISFIFSQLFLAVLGLCCCKRAFSSCSEWELLSRMWYANFSLQ